MYIGNIIINDSIKVDEHFNVISNSDDIIQDIPTLYVGIDNANTIGVELNYIERKIDDTTYWTFNKKEKRVLFEEDLFYFIENSYKYLIKKINYKFVDVILTDKDELKEFFNNLQNIPDIVSFYHNNMVYIYFNKTIFGIDLKQLKFLNKNIDKFLSNIKEWSKVFLEGDEILIVYKKYLGMLNDEVKYIPLLYTISEDE